MPSCSARLLIGSFISQYMHCTMRAGQSSVLCRSKKRASIGAPHSHVTSLCTSSKCACRWSFGTGASQSRQYQFIRAHVKECIVCAAIGTLCLQLSHTLKSLPSTWSAVVARAPVVEPVDAGGVAAAGALAAGFTGAAKAGAGVREGTVPLRGGAKSRLISGENECKVMRFI